MSETVWVPGTALAPPQPGDGALVSYAVASPESALPGGEPSLEELPHAACEARSHTAATLAKVVTKDPRGVRSMGASVVDTSHMDALRAHVEDRSGQCL
jgi:hypothetical protein